MDEKLDKKCLVCEILKDNTIIQKHINTRLFNDVSIKEILLEFNDLKNIKTPSEYHIKQHKINCLKNFKPDIIIFEKSEVKEITELNIDLDRFKRMTLVEKDIEYQTILHELYYKKLFSLNNEKKVSKDEINALKSLYDLISTNNIDVSKLTFENNSEDIEKTGIELIRLVLSKQLISEKVAINISETLFKDFKEIKNIEKKRVNVFEYMTDSEGRQIHSLIEKANERSKLFTPMEWDTECQKLYQEEQLKKENLDLQNN